jgi:MFS family permease
MLRQALAADEARTLFTLSAFFIGFGVGQLLLGPLSDRFGRKRSLIAGLALYIVRPPNSRVPLATLKLTRAVGVLA